MAYQTIPLVLYGLGAALLLILAWLDYSDQNQRAEEPRPQRKRRVTQRPRLARIGMAFASTRNPQA